MLSNISGQEAAKLAVNPYGSVTINAASGAVTGNFWAIAFDSDTVIASLTLAEGSSGASILAGLTHPAGVTKFLNITGIELTSGVATLYRAEPAS